MAKGPMKMHCHITLQPAQPSWASWSIMLNS